MSKDDLYIIERRRPDGVLDARSKPQPEDFFTMRAVHGITLDEMAKYIFPRKPDADLRGTNIPTWPANLHPEFVARRRPW